MPKCQLVALLPVIQQGFGYTDVRCILHPKIATGRPSWTSKMYRGLLKFLLSVQNWYPRRPNLSKNPPTFNELYDVWCLTRLLIGNLLPELRLSLMDVPLSACGSFIDSCITCRGMCCGTPMMAVWSLHVWVFVKRVELINWYLYNLTFSWDTRKYSVARVQNVDYWTQNFLVWVNFPGCAIYSWQPYQFQNLTNTRRMYGK